MVPYCGGLNPPYMIFLRTRRAQTDIAQAWPFTQLPGQSHTATVYPTP